MRYGRVQPPSYRISNVAVPTYLYAGNEDLLVSDTVISFEWDTIKYLLIWILFELF